MHGGAFPGFGRAGPAHEQRKWDQEQDQKAKYPKRIREAEHIRLQVDLR